MGSGASASAGLAPPAAGEDASQVQEDTALPVTEVLEYRPHEDGYLQLELRRYIRRDGSARERGPYWYFQYHEGVSVRSSTSAKPATRRVLWPPCEQGSRRSRLVLSLHILCGMGDGSSGFKSEAQSKPQYDGAESYAR